MASLAARLAHAPIRILQLLEAATADSGGTARCVSYQCRSIAAPDFEVALAFPHTERELAPEVTQLEAHGVSLHPLTRSRAAASDLARLVRRSDVVHYNGLWSPLCLWVGRLAARAGRPLVITPHGLLEPEAIAHSGMMKRIAMAMGYRRVLRGSSVLHAAAQSEAAHLREFGLSQPIAVIPNAVVVPQRPGSFTAKDQRKQLLFLSSIHPKSGLLELVRAVSRHQSLLEQGPWRLVVAGSDDDGHWAEVQNEAQRLGVLHLIDYVGHVDDERKWELYTSATVFVLPTHHRDPGLAIAEALACGTPCLTTTTATPWQELAALGCGWWHPVGQNELEQALAAALNTPLEVLAQMGERGAALVRRRHDIHARRGAFHDLYDWTLRRRTDHPEFFYES